MNESEPTECFPADSANDLLANGRLFLHRLGEASTRYIHLWKAVDMKKKRKERERKVTNERITSAVASTDGLLRALGSLASVNVILGTTPAAPGADNSAN
jgi:hypothetical protein